jgi:acyl dehydratase
MLTAASPPSLPPADQRYFEDYASGAVYRYGPVTVGRDEVVAFAAAYDPQPMHVDEVAATGGPWGGLIASGWHTAGIMMRLYVDNFLSPVSALVSPGVDELRWKAPVRPGDALTLQVTVLETRRLRSDPMKGTLKVRMEGFNQDGELVASLVGTTFMKCRAPEQAA